MYIFVRRKTCRNAATEQGHLGERRFRGKLDNTGGVDHGVLRESGRIEEMEDGLFPVFGGKPAPAVVNHDAFKRIHSESLAQIGLLRLAVDALPTLSIEYGHHMIAFSYLHHTLSHTLHHSATKKSQLGFFPEGKC